MTINSIHGLNALQLMLLLASFTSSESTSQLNHFSLSKASLSTLGYASPIKPPGHRKSRGKRSHNFSSMIRFSHAALTKTKRKYREISNSKSSSGGISQYELDMESSPILTEVGINDFLTQTRCADEEQMDLDLLSYRNEMESLPVWLRYDVPPSADAINASEDKLRSSMKIRFSTSDINTVLSAARIASKDSLEKLSGVLDFLYILVDVMDLGKPSLIAAAFHYCSCVSVREMPECKLMMEDRDNIYHPDTQYLFPLTNSGIQNFGEHVMKIAFDTARLKGIENVAATLTSDSEAANTRQTKDSASLDKQYGFRRDLHFDNMRSLLLSANAGGDWRALAIRSGACLYRLQGLLSYRFSHPDRANEVFPSREEIRLSREALQIYAPLAHRLGMHRLKSELEGTAFQLLYRRQHSAVTRMLYNVNREYDKIEVNKRGIPRQGPKDAVQFVSSFAVDTVDHGMKSVLEDLTLKVKRLLHEDDTLMSHVSSLFITARVKEPLSLWKKMLKIQRNKADALNGKLSVLDVPDASALRVILTAKKQTPDEDNEVTQARGEALCYYVQELLTSELTPEQHNTFKDYIKSPKENGYQSLHFSAKTRWHGKDWPFEVQIRTSEMHRVAEYGLAAHWEYKLNKKQEELTRESSLNTKDKSQKENNEHDASMHFPSLRKKQISIFTDDKSAADVVRSERVRLRALKLAPYIEALSKSRQDLARERVFVFLSYGNSISSLSEQGAIISLPAGACIIDALKKGEERGLTSSIQTDGSKFLRNGIEVQMTDKLENGDLLTIFEKAKDPALISEI